MNPEADPPAADGMSVTQVIKAPLHRNADERWDELFAREYKPLVSYLVGRRMTRVEAEDVAAQAFAQLLQSKDRASISQGRAYLYKIARNITVNKYNHIAMQQRHGPLLEAGQSEESPSPEPGLIQQQRSALIRHVLLQLPLTCRRCVVLRFCRELSFPEIVEWFHRRGMRINEKTVRRNVEKGLAEIRIAILAVEAPAEEARK